MNTSFNSMNTSAKTHFEKRIESVPVYIREIVTGGIAGAAAKTSVAPLERCKILFQTGRLHDASVRTTLMSIKRQEGLKGFFKGNGASVLRIIPYASIHFGLYEHYRRVLVDVWYGKGYLSAGATMTQRAPPPRPQLSPSSSSSSSSRSLSRSPSTSSPVQSSTNVSPMIDLLAGSGSGATAVLITYPLDFVRTRLAYSMETGHQRSMRQTIRGTLRETLQAEGLLGLYRGIGPSIYGILPYAGLKFYVYQQLKQIYFSDQEKMRQYRDGSDNEEGPATRDREEHAGGATRLPAPFMLLFGGIAGLVAQTATYPIDVVRRRMQVEGLRADTGTGVPERCVGGAEGASSINGKLLPRTTPRALLFITRNEGWNVLWAGLSINYMKVVPSTAIGFTLYDMLKQKLLLPSNL